MWKGIYDPFLQTMTVSWAKYISQYRSAGTTVRNNFQNLIYPDIGLWLIVFPLMSALLYYYYLNYKFGRYYNTKYWIITMMCNAIIVGVVTYIRSKSLLGHPVINVSKHLIWISIINATYSIILFFAISFIIKSKSPMGKKTPF